MSANEWADIISEHSHLDVETPTKGYKTARELCVEWNLQIAQTNRIICEMMEKKKIERRKFRIKTGHKTYPVPHYKIIKK